jgi:hypothetical protein
MAEEEDAKEPEERAEDICEEGVEEVYAIVVEASSSNQLKWMSGRAI